MASLPGPRTPSTGQHERAIGVTPPLFQAGSCLDPILSIFPEPSPTVLAPS